MKMLSLRWKMNIKFREIICEGKYFPGLKNIRLLRGILFYNLIDNASHDNNTQGKVSFSLTQLLDDITIKEDVQNKYNYDFEFVYINSKG